MIICIKKMMVFIMIPSFNLEVIAFPLKNVYTNDNQYHLSMSNLKRGFYDHK